MRANWINLNGQWEFEFDDDNTGIREKWYDGKKPLPRRIHVPFAYQSQLSGINDQAFHEAVWYRTQLHIPASFKNKRILLHFGAVDYEASVWVNGMLVAAHQGGHTPFCADITDALDGDGGGTLVVKAADFHTDMTLPRGKQYWKEKSDTIFYTGTTGIWQTVWMEAVSAIHLDKVKMTPDVDRKEIAITAHVKGAMPNKSRLRVKAEISFNGQAVSEDVFTLANGSATRKIHIGPFNEHGFGGWWSPEHPHLYDVKFSLLDGEDVLDEVESYFGMRKVSVEAGKLCLNNHPYFLRLVLDQGYFPDGNLTPPSDEAIRKDVELTKAMGFNGVRKHQKLEDPRFLYWCDKLGLVVWSEAANAYDFSDEYARKFTKEWMESIERDYNHPAIIAWVPLNESWGVPNILVDKEQQNHALSLYHLTKTFDPMRFVISNDGWESVKTDLISIHDYEWRREVLLDRYSSAEQAIGSAPSGRRILVEGYPYEGQPLLVTEFGGIACKKSEWDGWGYSGATSDEDFMERLRNVVQPMYLAAAVQGFCYTQLTDVEQEINGLLTYDRVPKLPLETIREIVTGKK
ncbi:glycoside hydrolase family 2 protein [Cohnella sp. 56]|uniref:glycoside hydrolase family 2 protein n=1 Tax=Cohnella sp. 56 TaxID=3113722 RepID=UPI0030EA5225